MGVVGVRVDDARKLATQGERHSLELLALDGRRPAEPGILFEWTRLRCEGEFGRSEESEDCLLNDGAARVFDLMGIVRTVNFGTSRSAEDVSSLRRLVTLDFRGCCTPLGNTEHEGDGEGERSTSMLRGECEGSCGPGFGEVDCGSISGIAFERDAVCVSS